MKLLLLSVLLMGVAVLPALAQDEAAADATAVEEPAPAAPAAEAPAAAAAAPAAAVEKAAAEKEEDKCSKGCPVITVQHYDAKGCHPQMDVAVDECCPASYTCKSETERGVAMTSCFYGNKTYEIGQDVPVNGPCRRGCRCDASLDKDQPAKIVCAIVECPSQFSPLRPGCRNKFSIDECCPVEQECNTFVPEEVILKENVTLRSADCFSEGLEYYIGDKIFFTRAPCQYCVCTDEFSGSNGPNCTNLDCPMEYRDREYLRNGCTPLYMSGTCCPADWVCPGSPQIINDSDLVAKGDETASTHCTLGTTVAPRGTALKTYNCHVNCVCRTPPDFTCLQYDTCEVALAAIKAEDAP